MAREPKTYVWDELENEIHRGPAQNTDGWKHVKTHKSGVREYRSMDRNHLALETEAVDQDDAHKKFLTHKEYKEFNDY